MCKGLFFHIWVAYGILKRRLIQQGTFAVAGTNGVIRSTAIETNEIPSGETCKVGVIREMRPSFSGMNKKDENNRSETRKR